MLREIIAKLGVNIDDKDVHAFMGVLDKAKASMGGLAKALTGGAFVLFAKSAIEAGDEVGDLAEKLGVSTDELQAFEFIMQRATGSSEGYDKAIFFLTKSIGEAATKGGEASAAFSALGISVKDQNGNVGQALDILPALADEIRKAGSHAEKTALAQKFFGKASKDIIPLMDQGAEGIARLTKEFQEYGGGLSKDFIDQAAEAADMQDRFRVSTKALTSQVMLAFMPAINAALKVVAKWIKWFVNLSKTTTLVKTGAIVLSTILAVKLIPQILSAVKAISALRTTVFGASFPFLLVAAAVAVLVLLFDDLWNMVQGNDSVIGDLLDKYGEAGSKAKVIEALKTAWTNVKTALEPVLQLFKDIWARIAEGSDKWIPALAQAFVGVVKAIAAGVAAFAGLISAVKKVSEKDFKGALGEIDKAGDSIFGKNQSYYSKDENGNDVKNTQSVGGLFGMSQKEYDAAASNTGRSPTITQTNQIKAEVKVINADGMTGDQASKATSSGLSQSMSDAMAALQTMAPAGVK